jgi:hypothetical protein
MEGTQRKARVAPLPEQVAPRCRFEVSPHYLTVMLCSSLYKQLVSPGTKGLPHRPYLQMLGLRWRRAQATETCISLRSRAMTGWYEGPAEKGITVFQPPEQPKVSTNRRSDVCPWHDAWFNQPNFRRQ